MTNQVRGQEEETMRLKTRNQKILAMNGSRCRYHIPRIRLQAGPENGHGAQLAYPSRMAGVVKGAYPPGSADNWSKIPQGIIPKGDT
jgi:hypothetical protein